MTDLYIYVIDQARGQDGWILAEFSFCVFMDRNEVEVHKNAKRERGQHPAILTELACLIAQKEILVSRNELRETENIGATDLGELIANFLLQVREFLFLICVKKTISMKILVLRVINSSRHRNCFVRGYIHS